MPDLKVTALTEDTSPSTDDVIYVVNDPAGVPASRKATLANVFAAITLVTLGNTGLHLFDTDASHDLIVSPGSNLTADRTLTITTGDADRTLTINASTTLGGGSHSGTNTGDQTIELTGDVTGSGTGSFAATIADDAVTYAKMQNVSATDRLLGRDTALAGNVEELTVGGGVEFTGAGGIQLSAFTGDVTKAAGGTALTIADDAVTYAKMQNISATDRLLGRDTAAAGDTEELTVTGGVEFSGAGGIQRSALTGDVTAAAGSNTTVIAVVTTKGDILTYTTVPARLAVGTNGQVLSAESAETTGLKWVAAAAGSNHAILDASVHTDSAADGVSRGSLIIGNSTPAWDELVIGTVGKVLYSDGTDVSWRDQQPAARGQDGATETFKGWFGAARGGAGSLIPTAANDYYEPMVIPGPVTLTAIAF